MNRNERKSRGRCNNFIQKYYTSFSTKILSSLYTGRPAITISRPSNFGTVVLRLLCILMFPWKPNSMETAQHGNWPTWKPNNMETEQHGNRTTLTEQHWNALTWKRKKTETFKTLKLIGFHKFFYLFPQNFDTFPLFFQKLLKSQFVDWCSHMLNILIIFCF